MKPTLLVLVALVLSAVFAESSQVLSLNSGNIDKETSGDGLLFVKFFAPWCGHCKALAPTWEKLAALVKKEKIPIRIGEVDCTTQADLCTKYEIAAYPTLLILKNGENVANYEGPRSLDDLAKFAKNPKLKEPSNDDALKKQIETLQLEQQQLVNEVARLKVQLNAQSSGNSQISNNMVFGGLIIILLGAGVFFAYSRVPQSMKLPGYVE